MDPVNTGGVLFFESTPPNVQVLAPISTELNGFFSQNQLRTLDDLKTQMCRLAIQRGGNCIIGFKCGQRSTFWKSLIGMDDVLWYGTGYIGLINKPSLKRKNNETNE
jgi:hypothetical protein